MWMRIRTYMADGPIGTMCRVGGGMVAARFAARTCETMTRPRGILAQDEGAKASAHDHPVGQASKQAQSMTRSARSEP